MGKRGEGGQRVDEFFWIIHLGSIFFWDDFLGLGWGGFLLDWMKMMIQLRKLMQGKTMCFLNLEYSYIDALDISNIHRYTRTFIGVITPQPMRSLGDIEKYKMMIESQVNYSNSNG